MLNNPMRRTVHQITALASVHSFPARMAPSIIWRELPASGRPICVLDPMSGSGTALVTARMSGHKSIGFDSDPLAVLIARAWCADVNETETRKKAEEVLVRANRRYRGLRLSGAYPRDAEANRRQLTALAHSISRVRDGAVRELLWCAFSRLIITKQAGASLAMDVSHSRPHRAFERAPIKPLDRFIRSVDAVLKVAPFKNQSKALKTKVRLGDARRLPIPDSSVDLVITSPPYLNAIDYLRGHKLSLVWMGYSVKQIRAIRSTSVGTECSKDSKNGQKYAEEALNRMDKVEELPDRFRRMLVQYVFDKRPCAFPATI
jgi:hypothetical protein